MSDKREFKPASPIELTVLILKCAAIYTAVIVVFLYMVGVA